MTDGVKMICQYRKSQLELKGQPLNKKNKGCILSSVNRAPPSTCIQQEQSHTKFLVLGQPPLKQFHVPPNKEKPIKNSPPRQHGRLHSRLHSKLCSHRRVRLHLVESERVEELVHGALLLLGNVELAQDGVAHPSLAHMNLDLPEGHF